MSPTPPNRFQSCFFSTAGEDEEFAKHLHFDLQKRGIQCWFAPTDMKIGDRIGETIDTAIRLKERLLVVLSEKSITRAWVVREVKTALNEESRSERPVLVPIRIDDAVLHTTEQWAHDLRRTRHIGDFSRWRDPDAYGDSLRRLVRDLTVSV